MTSAKKGAARAAAGPDHDHEIEVGAVVAAIAIATVIVNAAAIVTEIAHHVVMVMRMLMWIPTETRMLVVHHRHKAHHRELPRLVELRRRRHCQASEMETKRNKCQLEVGRENENECTGTFSHYSSHFPPGISWPL